MVCAWDNLLAILPQRMRMAVNEAGSEAMEELRLRINAPPEVVLPQNSIWLEGTTSRDDLNYVINAASRYSPWAASTVTQGYLTAPGGHRIGVCGYTVYGNGRVEGIRDISSLCIRVARDYKSIGRMASGPVLILGAPGWGKTTLLRDVIRQTGQKFHVCTVDERGELFPELFSSGSRCDVLTNCPKAAGIEMVLRCMSPDFIAVDEITAQEDIQAVLHCAYCGVPLLATAHAASLEDFYSRPAYRPLLEHKVFSTVYLLNREKRYTVERLVWK